VRLSTLFLAGTAQRAGPRLLRTVSPQSSMPVGDYGPYFAERAKPDETERRRPNYDRLGVWILSFPWALVIPPRLESGLTLGISRGLSSTKPFPDRQTAHVVTTRCQRTPLLKCLVHLEQFRGSPFVSSPSTALASALTNGQIFNSPSLETQILFSLVLNFFITLNPCPPRLNSNRLTSSFNPGDAYPKAVKRKTQPGYGSRSIGGNHPTVINLVFCGCWNWSIRDIPLVPAPALLSWHIACKSR
jgi:hypothetical protein